MDTNHLLVVDALLVVFSCYCITLIIPLAITSNSYEISSFKNNIYSNQTVVIKISLLIWYSFFFIL